MKKKQAPRGSQDRTAVGKLIGCFGVKGFLKVQPFTRDAGRFEKLKKVFVGSSAEDAALYDVDAVETMTKGTVIRFSSVPDRNAAEPLVGKILFVDRDGKKNPPKGSYFIDDVIGCEVVTTDGRKIGTIKEVYAMPGHDLWEIATDAGSSILPAVKEFIKEVDLKQRRITVELIDGLIGTMADKTADEADGETDRGADDETGRSTDGATGTDRPGMKS